MKLRVLKHMLVMFVVNHLCDGAYLFEVKRLLLNSIGYHLGEGTKVVGPVYCNAELKTGSNCWLGRNFTIHGNGLVELGDNCDIAPDVTFLTGRQTAEGEERKASIRVGDGSWIGAGTTLSRNVTIGKGSMVLAAACVMKSMPENTLIGGVPARIVRKLDDVEGYE